MLVFPQPVSEKAARQIVSADADIFFHFTIPSMNIFLNYYNVYL